MNRSAAAYDADFYAWTQEQTEALRRAAEARVNLDLDFVNLAEEIESMGSEQLFAIESAFTRAMEHLLKLEYSPAGDPRRGWQDSVAHQQVDIAKRLRRNPSLKSRLAEVLADAWPDARRLAARALSAMDGIDPGVLPAECPYTLDQIRDHDWWPVNRHGLD